jgi:hypothetical protein
MHVQNKEYVQVTYSSVEKEDRHAPGSVTCGNLPLLQLKDF